MLDAPEGATVLLEVRPEHAAWLNTYRTVLVSRQLKLVAWATVAHANDLANAAPDFWDWISHLVEAPGGPHGFARRGLAQAGPRIAWVGDDLDRLREASGRVGASLRVGARVSYQELVEAAAAPGWLLVDGLDDPEQLVRLRWALAEARRSETSVLMHPKIAPLPGWCPLHDRAMSWTAAHEQVGERGKLGIVDAARVALLLDLEPEAIERVGALSEVDPGRRGELLLASDPGVALLETVPEAAKLGDPSDALVWRAGLQALPSDDEVETLLFAAPSAERWLRLAELALSLRQWEAAQRWAEAVDDPSIAEAADALRSYAISRQRPPRAYVDPQFDESAPHHTPPYEQSASTVRFVDREAELEALHAQLVAQGSLVVVQGMAGVGKTELVAQYAYRHLHDYDVVAWAQVGARKLEDVLSDLARALLEPAEPLPSTTAELIDLVSKALKERPRVLVVLDDVRDADNLWLPVHGHVLVTSRRRDLPVPERASTLELGVLAPGHALTLLLGERQLQGPQLQAARELSAWLGGLPLSLAIARQAMHARELMPQELLVQLREDPSPLRLNLNLEERLSWSFAQLDTNDGLARDMLLIAACLADAAIPFEVITGALTQLRAAELQEQALQIARTRLVDLGLANVEEDGLRLYSAVALVARSRASDAHAQAAVHGLAGFVRRVVGNSSSLSVLGLSKLRPHLRQVVERTQRGISDDEFVLTLGLARELRMTGDYPGALRVCEHGLALVEDEAQRAPLLAEAGHTQLGMGRVVEAET
jgi:hypothetical protein